MGMNSCPPLGFSPHIPTHHRQPSARPHPCMLAEHSLADPIGYDIKKTELTL